MSGYHDNYGGGDGYGDGYGDPYGIQQQQQQQSMYSTVTAEDYGDHHHHPYYHSGSAGGGGGLMVGGMSSSDDEEDIGYNIGSGVGGIVVGNDDDEDDDNMMMHNDEDDIVDGEDDDSEVIDFDDPSIADLPRILLMGPRRGGKTSIQRVVFHKMSPHETLFRLEATQNLERAVVDHTPLCRFTIWDFPGDYYGPTNHNNNHTNDHHVGNYMDGYYNSNPTNNTANNMNSMNTASSDNNHINKNTSPMGIPTMQRQPIVHGINFQQQQQSLHHPSLGTDLNDTTSANRNNVNNDTTNNPNDVKDGDTTTNNNNDGDAYIFGRATALIFVIDAQDEPYDHVLQNFTETVSRAIRANPHIAIEVFINKVDGELFLSDDAKYDCRRDVMQQVSDELADMWNHDNDNNSTIPTISYHLTSIYDHSVFEAFSRVVQKLIPQLPTLENLLNVLVSTCSMEKAYLFDVASKLYISTDSSPVDMQSVELCSDMIDVVLDVSGIYGHHHHPPAIMPPDETDDNHKQNNEEEEENNNNIISNSNTTEQLLLQNDTENSQINHTATTTTITTNKSENMNQIGEDLINDMGGPTKLDATAPTIVSSHDHHDNDIPTHITQDDTNNINTAVTGLEYGGGIMVDPKDELVGTLISQGAEGEIEENDDDEKNEDETDPDSAYDHQSSSIIRLSNGMVLYLKEVDTMLALVCLTRSENFVKKSLINYNIGCLKKALRSLVKPVSTDSTTPSTTLNNDISNNNNNTDNGRTW